jgi:hypothetical protein
LFNTSPGHSPRKMASSDEENYIVIEMDRKNHTF